MLAVIAATYVAAKEQERWDRFARTHNCVLVEYVKGQTITSFSNAISSDGNVTIVPTTTHIPDKRAFKCDDGVTYWR